MEFFKGIRLYLKDKETGLLAMKFVCCKCGKEIDEPASFWIPCSSGHVPLIHQTEFLCKECHNGGSNNGEAR